MSFKDKMNDAKLKAKVWWEMNSGIVLGVGLPFACFAVSAIANVVEQKKTQKAIKAEADLKTAIEYTRACEIYDRRNGFYITCKRPLSNYEKVLIDQERSETNKTTTEILREHGYIADDDPIKFALMNTSKEG